jgi:hypothetical protein
MLSKNQNSPFYGCQQGVCLNLLVSPLDDPYAYWRIDPDPHSGAIFPSRRIPPKRGSFSGYVPFQELGRVVWYESLLEQRLLLAIKHVFPVPGVLEQPLTLNLKALGFKGTRYTPDYLLWSDSSTPTLVEVKYEADLKKDWGKIRPKLLAGLRYARWRGWHFRLVTDRHLHPDGIQTQAETVFGLVSPYSRKGKPLAEARPKPVIWGALPGHSPEIKQLDRSSLLIPTTARLLGRILGNSTHIMGVGR